MAKFTKEYEAKDFTTSGGKIDLDTLNSKINGVFKDLTTKPWGTGVKVYSDEIFTVEKSNTLDQIIADHTGIVLPILIKDTSNKNRLILQEILSIAINRPDLEPYADAIVDYYIHLGSLGLTEAFVYYGPRGQYRLKSQIEQDTGEILTIAAIPAASRNAEQIARYNLLSVLLVEVTPPSPELPAGAKAYEFFIGKIMGLI